MALHKNYINGEWVEGKAPRKTSILPMCPTSSANMPRPTRRRRKRPLPPPRPPAPAGRQPRRSSAPIFSKPSASSCWPARTKSAGCLSREEGKPLANGIAETMRAAQIFKFFAQEALRIEGVAVASVRPGVDVPITREPLGVVGLICPWNFPIAIPAWKMAPALAFGNTVVFKPADLVPGTAWALVEILSRAGLPKGVLNLVMGRGSVVGQAMLDSRGRERHFIYRLGRDRRQGGHGLCGARRQVPA